MTSMTDEDYKKLLELSIEQAIALKKKSDPDKEEMPPIIAMIDPDSDLIPVPILPWGNEDQKHYAMHVLSLLCKKIDALAALVVSDTRTLNVDHFCEHFDVPNPQMDRSNFDAFMKRRAEVMKQFGGYMGNMPAEFYLEALTGMVYGPKVKMMATVQYRVTDAKTYIFDEPKTYFSKDDGRLSIGLIPAWWT